MPNSDLHDRITRAFGLQPTSTTRLQDKLGLALDPSNHRSVLHDPLSAIVLSWANCGNDPQKFLNDVLTMTIHDMTDAAFDQIDSHQREIKKKTQHYKSTPLEDALHQLASFIMQSRRT